MKKLERKFNSAFRYLIVYGLSRIFKYYIITEYPRSGGSWLANMLADYLDIPFPASRLPEFKSSVIHGHYLYKPTMTNVIFLVRDVRDVIVSYYFYTMFYSQEKNPALYKKFTYYISFDNLEEIRKNLPLFIEKLFVYKIYPRFTWQEIIDSFYGKKDLILLRYEDLLNNTFYSMVKVLDGLGFKKVDEDKLKKVITKYSFENMAKNHHNPDPKKSFLRKGKSGDWKNYFSKESAELIEKYAGKGLRLMGYEKDNSWVKNIKDEN